MSTKSTILLSQSNEHWYYDCSDDSFNIEFNREHIDINEIDSEGGFLFIKTNTALHRAISTEIMKWPVCKVCGHTGNGISCPCGSKEFYKRDSNSFEPNQDRNEKMSIQQFTDKIDGNINDFVNYIIDHKTFKSNILDLLIKVIKPYLKH